MIGAIKRRWKSTKKAKVLHKGGELSASNDICPTSRGFTLVDSSTEDFSDKMIKPPSPRQIHPVLEKGGCGEGGGSGKYGQLPPLPPNALNGRKSLSGIDECKVPSTSPPPPPTGFIHVNSGRIELVSNRFAKDQQQQQSHESKLLWRNGPCLIKGGNKGTSNDARHSWCGSVFRGGMDVTHPRKALEDHQRNSQNFHNQPQVPSQPPPSAAQQNSLALTATLLNPLKDRLTAIEDLTKGLQTQQTEAKVEFQQCLSELALQVSKAVAIHGAMKSEVEKLHSRMVSLENHNKAMTTMIIPTLMKLQETITVAKERPLRKKLGGQKSPITGAAKSVEEERRVNVSSPNGRRTTGQGTFTSSSTSSCGKQQRSIQSARGEGGALKSSKYCGVQQRKVVAGECRIPRMSDGKLSRSSENTSKGGSNKSSGSNISESKGKSELIKSNVSSNRLENGSPSLSQSSSSGDSSAKKLGGRIPRKPRSTVGISTELPPPSQTSSTPPCPSVTSKLPVRKTISSTNATPLVKHPAATSRSLPNHASKVINSGQDGKQVLKSVIKQTQRVSGIPVQKSGGLQNVKLGSGGRIGGGKDEGYSTMSSEALVEQETGSNNNKGEVSLDEGSKGQIESKGSRDEMKSPLGKEKRCSIQKSNTFNTFREIGTPISVRNKVVIPACVSPSKIPLGGTQFTTVATVSILEPASITTTSDNVRIIRGRPFDIKFDDSKESTENSSSATVLWEDSDDSDILFLPIEMSSEESGGCDSESTLIPTSYASWTMSSGENATLTPTPTPPTPKTAEQRELIEKWMRLEDVRHESQWEEEWAWDWDGVERSMPSHKAPVGHRLTPPSIIISEVAEDESEEEEFWFASRSQKQQGSSSRRNEDDDDDAPESCSPQIDSSTWTKSKCSKMKKLLEEGGGGAPESLISQNGANKEEGEDELTPPVVEFTREFYRLANYGSNLSFVESPAGRRGRTSPAGQSDIAVSVDDKIIQTDFTNNSSLENMSVSSDLFAECRNCLEIMKKLVGSTSESTSDIDVTEGMMNLSEFERRLAELSSDVGCSSPTSWVSVPKGVTTTEVDKILEILSSSESEDVHSPGP